MNLCNDVKNPLTDEVINYFLNSYLNKENLYNAAVGLNYPKKINRGLYSVSNRDKLYSNLFNVWKGCILNLSDEQIKYMIDNSVVENDFFGLRDSLKNISGVDGYDAYFRLLRTEELVQKYGWHNFEYGEWTHINSYMLTYGICENFNVEHRLYLNPSPTDTDNIVNNFIYGCANANLPFYLKYDAIGDRDDTIVIYSNTENLEEYINILNDILQTHPDIKKRMEKPPVLSGIINDVIGYGSDSGRQNDSFNKKRANLIKKSIEEVLGGIFKIDLKNISKIDKLAFINNPDIIDMVRKRIEENSLDYGVDDNFCFDVDKKELLANKDYKNG